MTFPDLNLLVPLDALLAEGSVARAAQRLRVSPSSMSRTLARLRDATGDPLLVRAGQGLVPTPYALELRARVAAAVGEASAVLRPATSVDLASVERTFTLRASEGFVETFGAQLIARGMKDAPRVRFHFRLKSGGAAGALRDGELDLEIGVVDARSQPELRQQGLFRDRLVGVVRTAHPLAGGRVTAARYAKARHVAVYRRSTGKGRVDTALETVGLARDVACTVSGFSGALALARSTDLVATVPDRHTALLRRGLHTFTLPLHLPDIPVSMLWHPRHEQDSAHRWLRGVVRDTCIAARARHAAATEP